MTTIVRLEGLHETADTTDIDQFFKGFCVCDIQIVRGERGEAFVVFASDEDVQFAMKKSGSRIKDKRVLLSLSNKAEMLQAIEQYRKKVEETLEVARQQTKKKKLIMLLKQPSTFYVYLTGIAQTTTEHDIKIFFKHLSIREILIPTGPDGSRTGNAFVKFASESHANEALKLHKQQLSNRCVGVMRASEEQWVRGGGAISESAKPGLLGMHPTDSQQFFIYLINLPPLVTKNDIRVFLEDPQIDDFNISILKNSAFVMLKNEMQQQMALWADGKAMYDYRVSVFPIFKQSMLDIAVSHAIAAAKRELQNLRPNNPSLQRCIHMKNLFPGATKLHIQEFFDGFPLQENDIFLRYDGNGYSTGEALVRFPTEKVAVCAARLNKEWFMGTEVFLRCISEDEMKAYIGSNVYESNFPRH
ncbi:hypothetical protein GDO86_010859 [Hymenochirus boettgeri]|uniref:RRM domain-containing protein n=1 Tax=Hymenochirus boettgeri TaxID=247094 RepID=A0A8T2JE23_9PIPI|nr:hypothetical protein GDO86_010859 [Hymenochirus boettgeri]